LQCPVTGTCADLSEQLRNELLQPSAPQAHSVFQAPLFQNPAAFRLKGGRCISVFQAPLFQGQSAVDPGCSGDPGTFPASGPYPPQGRKRRRPGKVLESPLHPGFIADEVSVVVPASVGLRGGRLKPGRRQGLNVIRLHIFHFLFSNPSV
jgi:hypothetical protein